MDIEEVKKSYQAVFKVLNKYREFHIEESKAQKIKELEDQLAKLK